MYLAIMNISDGITVKWLQRWCELWGGGKQGPGAGLRVPPSSHHPQPPWNVQALLWGAWGAWTASFWAVHCGVYVGGVNRFVDGLVWRCVYMNVVIYVDVIVGTCIYYHTHIYGYIQYIYIHIYLLCWSWVDVSILMLAWVDIYIYIYTHTVVPP